MIIMPVVAQEWTNTAIDLVKACRREALLALWWAEAVGGSSAA